MRPILLFLLTTLLITSSLQAEEIQLEPYRNKKLRIGTKVAPPFVIQKEDGSLGGISIELWEKTARELELEYEYKVYDLDNLFDAVTQQQVDVAVGAFTITKERERRMDFTVPYFITSSSIAVRQSDPGIWAFVKAFFSKEFLKAVGGLLLLLFLVGVVIWLLERRANPEQFGGKGLYGIGSGLWWSAVTMTTVGYGDKAPTTFFGRILGLIWMFVALIVISSFTATIASSLTLRKLSTYIESPEDLAKVKVGTIEASSSETYLQNKKYDYRTFPELEAMMSSLEEKQVDAVVYDDALLRYSMKKSNFNREVTVLNYQLQQMYYGFALPSNSSELREALNRQILESVTQEEWKDIQYKYLGYMKE